MRHVKELNLILMVDKFIKIYIRDLNSIKIRNGKIDR
jgi:hypothetical protein